MAPASSTSPGGEVEAEDLVVVVLGWAWAVFLPPASSGSAGKASATARVNQPSDVS